MTRAALDGVVALFSEKIVVTASAFDSVFPFASQDGVRSIPANEVVAVSVAQHDRGVGGVGGWRGSVRQGEVRRGELRRGDAPELDRAVERVVCDADPAPVLLVDDGEVGERDRLGQIAHVDDVFVDFEFVDDVVVRLREVDEGIRAQPADHHVVARPADEDVVSTAASEGVVTLTAPEVIVASGAQEVVVAGAPAQEVGALAAVDEIVAASAAHDVAAVSTAYDVVARSAEHYIAALVPLEHVALAPALHDVVAAPAVDRVMAGAADQDVGLIRRFAEVGHRCLLLAHPSNCIGGRVGERRLPIPFY